MPREEIVSGDDRENIVGALTTALAQRAMGGWRAAPPAGSVSKPAFSTSQLQTQVGGTQAGALRAPLGLGFHSFTALGTFKFIVEPQEAFRGERLIVSVVKDGAAGTDVVVNSIVVGSLPQQPSTEFGTPASMFQPDATDAHMDWQICPAGTKIIIEVEVIGAAIGEADSVTVSVGLYGVWIRG